MATLLFASNEPNATIQTTDPGDYYAFSPSAARVFDPKYSPRGEFRVLNGARIYCHFSEPVSIGEEFWIHFRAYYGMRSGSLNTSSGHILSLFSNLNPAARILSLYAHASEIAPGGGFNLQIYKASNLIGGSVPVETAINNILGGSVATWDMKIKLDEVLGYILIYRNGVLFLTYFGDTTMGGAFTSLSGFWLSCPTTNYNVTTTSGIANAYTELLASRAKTLGQRVIHANISGDGDAQEWAGGYANIIGPYPNVGSVISAEEGDKDSLFTTPNPHGDLDPALKLAGLLTTAQVYNDGIGDTQRIAHLMKLSGGALHAGGALSLSEEHPISAQEWLLNPDTGEKWTLSELAGMQIGLRSKV